MVDIERLKNEEIQVWIEAHLTEQTHTLAFKKSPFDGIEMKDLMQQIQGRQIIRKKVPILNQKGILFPPKLNLEQTSSAITAEFKAQLIPGKSILDLTGGFGVDCIAFAQHYDQVIHIEQNEMLQSLAQHNFEHLGLTNISSHAQNSIAFLKETNRAFDVIYVDPSRRDEQKKRVFLLADLTPNILEHLSLFQQKSKEVLIKLSPLIDLNYLLKNLQQIAVIYVIAVKNEVKEVLVRISSEYQGETSIETHNLATTEPSFSFRADEMQHQAEIADLKAYLYEPNAALQKSGGTDVLAHQFGLTKLHPNTQLYSSDELKQDFPGRVFNIKERIKNPKKELKGKSIMAIHRNFPESLAQLRKKYKFTTDGVDAVLFTRTRNGVIIFKMNNISL